MGIMEMEKGSPIAIPWYENEESYLTVLSMLPASERQDPFAYDVFMAQTKASENRFKSNGFITYRVPIEAATVKAWCNSNNQPVCRKSIAEFIMAELAVRLRKSGQN
jgi:hypothetical protein